jgi:hypothetical protein
MGQDAAWTGVTFGNVDALFQRPHAAGRAGCVAGAGGFEAPYGGIKIRCLAFLSFRIASLPPGPSLCLFATHSALRSGDLLQTWIDGNGREVRLDGTRSSPKG